MKNYLLLFSLLLLAVSAKSQMKFEDMFPRDATYYIKGGSEIPYNKIDSVVRSWGGAFSKQEKDGKITLSPTTPSDLKAMKDEALKENAVLNQPAKAFTLTSIDGKSVTLAELRGKVVVINFWFTACAACIAEMPWLNKIKAQFAGKDVIFLGLGRDNVNAIKNFRDKHAFDFTLLANASKVDEDYAITTYPTTLVIDKAGIIRLVQVTGDKIEESVTASVNALL